MTILRPPRREPRAAALAEHADGIAFAIADAHELRSCAIERCRPAARGLAIRRIIRREKPTIVTARSPSLVKVATRAARGLRLPVVDGSALPLPPPDCARDLLPGMAYQAPTRALEAVVRLALATVLHAEETHRTYAHRNRSALRRSS